MYGTTGEAERDVNGDARGEEAGDDDELSCDETGGDKVGGGDGGVAGRLGEEEGEGGEAAFSLPFFFPFFSSWEEGGVRAGEEETSIISSRLCSFS